MTRYKYAWRAFALAGLLSAMAAGLSALPAGATLVCPPGTTNPKYCTNVLPIATTKHPTKIKGTRATLNGVSGPGVAGGDITFYSFQYGKTKKYGHQTKRGQVGHCPNGASRCPSVPASKSVSAKVSRLQPCTTYHYRIVSKNSDGRTNGKDARFRTHFASPIQKVEAPGSVGAGQKVKVKITLRYRAAIKIEFIRHGHVVKSSDRGKHGPGKFRASVSAPGAAGKYTLRVVGKLSCGTQDVDQKIRVR